MAEILNVDNDSGDTFFLVVNIDCLRRFAICAIVPSGNANCVSYAQGPRVACG